MLMSAAILSLLETVAALVAILDLNLTKENAWRQSLLPAATNSIQMEPVPYVDKEATFPKALAYVSTLSVPTSALKLKAVSDATQVTRC